MLPADVATDRVRRPPGVVIRAHVAVADPHRARAARHRRRRSRSSGRCSRRTARPRASGIPNKAKVDGLLFGTDKLGQDVWSRFLLGGRSILIFAVVATGARSVARRHDRSRRGAEPGPPRRGDDADHRHRPGPAVVAARARGDHHRRAEDVDHHRRRRARRRPRGSPASRVARRSRWSSATSSPRRRRSASRSGGCSCTSCCRTSADRCSSRPTCASPTRSASSSALALPRLLDRRQRRQLGHDDPGEPPRARPCSRGASCCRRSPSPCSRSPPD